MRGGRAQRARERGESDTVPGERSRIWWLAGYFVTWWFFALRVRNSSREQRPEREREKSVRAARHSSYLSLAAQPIYTLPLALSLLPLTLGTRTRSLAAS